MKNMVTWLGGNFAPKKRTSLQGDLRGNFFLPYFVLDVRASPLLARRGVLLLSLRSFFEAVSKGGCACGAVGLGSLCLAARGG